ENSIITGQATAADPRVTRFGKLLRRTSLDELPQLINVVRGQMSLVGPRPHAVSHDSAFWRVDSRYAHRFAARPGITGIAQVRGHRGLTDTPEKVEARLEHDLRYIETWSLASDLRIMCATVKVVFGDINAF